MNIPLLIMLCYIAVLFLISFYAKRRSEGSSENYILAGRQLSTPLIAVSIIGLAIGGASTIGVSEQAFKVGLSAGWYTVAWGAGAITMGFLLAKKYRQMNIATIPDLLERYYDRKSIVAGVACQIIIQLVITSLQYIAGGSILASLLPEIFTMQTGMITSAIVFIGITFIGGMWSASLANILNVTLIYVGITAATIIQVTSLGGINNIAIRLPANVPYFDFFQGIGWLGIVSWFIVMITVNLSLQSIVQISLGAKSVETARKGFIAGGIIMLPIGFLAAILGITAKMTFPTATAASALPQAIMSLNPFLAGITLAALWAADISTACNLLLSSATLFSQDIYKKFINPQVSDAKYVLITKSSVAVLGLLTFLLALTVSGIIKTLMVGLSLTTAFSVIVLFTMFAPRLCTKNSAFYTIISSLIVLLVWQFIPSVRIFPHVIYLEWLVCPIIFLMFSIFEPNSVAKPAVESD